MGLVGEEAEQKVVSITKALADIKGKQRVNAEEMSRQLQESGVAGWRYIAEELQRQYPKLSRLSEEQAIAVARDMAEHNRLDANGAINAIVRGLQREFGGTGKDINLNTLVGQEAMTEDNMSVIMGKATESLFRHKLLGQKALNQGLQGGAAERLAGYISAGTDSGLTMLEDGLRSLGVKLPKLGAEAGGSYATGFKSSAPEAYGAGTAVGDAAERGVRDRLDQHSPSQVMLSLGRDAGLSFTQGFNKGVLQGQGNSRAQIDEFVKRAAERFKLDPDLIKAVIKKESSYHSKAVSPMGARGLMQLMPGTAARMGVRDAFDPEQNIMGGAKYLRKLIDLFNGDVRLALAAYNAGEGAVLAHLPNRPDVNSYVGGSGRRWTVSEEAAQRAQGIPQNGQTPEYVRTIMRDYMRANGGAGASVPVTVQNLPPLKDFFSQFVGNGYTPALALGHAVPDRPASGDLTGGVGYFAEDFNPRGFAEKLYAMQKATPATERASVAALSDWEHTVSLMAEEFHVSRAVRQKIEGMVALRLEDERRALASLSAQGAADGGSFRPGSTFANITPEQAREAVKLATHSTGELKTEVGTLATTITPQALASVKLVAAETREAFQEVLPLVKESTEESERLAKKISGVLATYFGGALHAALRRDWRSFFEGLRDDALNFISTLAKDRIQKKIYEALSPKQNLSVDGGASSGGGLPGLNIGGAISGGRSGGFLGGLKGLLGFGGSAATAKGAAAAAGPWVDPVAFAAEFGAAPAMAGVGAGAASGSAAAGSTAAGAGAGGGFGGLTALMTNPWTIGIAAAAVTGFALWKHFSHGTEKALRKTIQSEYAINVKDMAVLKSVKEVGEGVFGKGNVKKHLLETIKLDAAKELLSAYAEQTGQNSSKLVTSKQLGDSTNPLNNFARREFGGPVIAGVPYLVGERRPEVFVPEMSGHIVPSVSEFMRGGARGPVGNVLKRVMDKVRARLAEQAATAAPSSSSAARAGSGGGGSQAAAIAALTEAVASLNSKIKGMRPGEVVGIAADEEPEIFGRANNASLRSGSVRQEQQERLGMRN
jgi:hypothetical protein